MVFPRGSGSSIIYSKLVSIAPGISLICTKGGRERESGVIAKSVFAERVSELDGINTINE